MNQTLTGATPTPTVGFALLRPLTDALRAHLDPDQGLLDPLLNAPTPVDYYGQTATALALLLRDGQASEQWRWPLRAWLRVAERQTGHAPFNRFLLLLMSRSLAGQADAEARALFAAGLRRCRLARSYPSNNWTLLARLCRLLEAPVARQSAQVAHFVALLDRWITADGAFIDFPARPPRGIGATPMTYHHKALFLATISAWFCDDPALRPRIEALLNQALHCWDGGGYAGGLGRSNHALFGDGCLVASLVLLGAMEDGAGELSAMCAGIIQRLESQRRGDGLYWLNPAGASGQASWDNYMFLSVYNAWFAAVVSWALHIRRTRPVPAVVSNIKPVQPSIQDEGLMRFRSDQLTALITTRGQPPQAFSRNEVELRYAGGIPVHVTVAGQVVIPPPVRIPLAELLRQPALAGWTPLFKQAERIYGLTDFDSVTVRESQQAIDIELTGRPVALTRAPIEQLPQRLMAALDWRLLGGAWGRREALRREVLAGISARMVLTLSVQPPTLAYHLVLENTGGQPVNYLNPAGHALVPDAWSCQQQVSGGQGELLTQPMPSSIAGAMGCSLPALLLPRGHSEYSIGLNWND